MATLSEVKAWDVNLDSGTGKAVFPPLDQKVYSLDQYVKHFEAAADEIQKSLATPPSMMTYARMSYMPDAAEYGILQWPGINPDALRRIVRENIAPQMIIGMRIDDMMRYSQPSNHLWRPGWRLELMEGGKHPTSVEKKDMMDAARFLQNCNIETGYSDARKRDAAQLTDFQHYLALTTRDTLTFDGIAVWTEIDDSGKIKAFKPLPAGQIRLAGPGGYKQNKDDFAVAVDEGGNIKATFNRKQLVWYVRNPRTDPEVGGYGYPEPEMAIRLIQGFQNAVDLNVDTFNRSGIPNGMLVLKGGGWTQRQLDVLSRIWTNLKKGITKVWALPVVAAPTEGDVSVVNLQDLKGTDVRYQDHMNMMAGASCTIYRFPVRRLGYRISGRGPDTQPNQESGIAMVDEDDPGMAPLLIHHENVINQYFIWSRWPHLRFVFTGKNPKEDHREYEAKKNAQTWGEARAEAGTKSLEDFVKDTIPAGEDRDDMLILARIMTMCPVDPNLAGSFQSVLGAFSKAKFTPDDAGGDPVKTENRMTSKKDPAMSAQHGHQSGVRRDSKTEKSS